jgi:glycosyltransferase involved in cell wall biosynthesis
MDIIFSCFQGFNNENPQGMNKILLPIAKRVAEERKVIYYNANSSVDCASVNLKPVLFCFRKLRNLISIVVPKFFFVKNKTGVSRYIQELLFDLFLSFRIRRPVLLVSGAYTNIAFRKNTKIGGINILIAGNPDDREVFKVLLSERKKFSLDLNDPYTYRRRINYIATTIGASNHLVLFTQSQLDTFSIHVDESKIFFQESYITPVKSTFPELDINKHSAFTACYIAHTVWLKGLVYLIDAWEHIGIPGAQLLIGGTVSEDVQNYLNHNYPILNGIKFLGRVDDINEFYRRSHVCIVPSLLDAGPATVAESLFCGTPVICTDGCGSKTLINENNGVVVGAGEADSIVKAIDTVYKKYRGAGYNKKDVKDSIRVNDIDTFEINVAKFILDKAS